VQLLLQVSNFAPSEKKENQIIGRTGQKLSNESRSLFTCLRLVDFQNVGKSHKDVAQTWCWRNCMFDGCKMSMIHWQMQLIVAAVSATFLL